MINLSSENLAEFLYRIYPNKTGTHFIMNKQLAQEAKEILYEGRLIWERVLRAQKDDLSKLPKLPKGELSGLLLIFAEQLSGGQPLYRLKLVEKANIA